LDQDVVDVGGIDDALAVGDAALLKGVVGLILDGDFIR